MPPRPGAKPALPAPDEIDLPALGRAPGGPAKPSGGDDFADFGEIGLDLPVVGGPAPAPAPPKAPPRAAPAPIEADLPVPVVPGAGGGGGFGEIDLPVPFGAPGPSPAPLPAPRAAVPDELDLPVVGGRHGAGGLDLPAVPGGGGGFGLADLPSPVGVGADLPSPAGFGADLPAPRGTGASFGELDLPSLSADLPTIGGDLPMSPQAGLPVPAGDLPVSAAGLPVAAAGLPAMAAGLPSAAAGLPSAAAGLPMNAAGLPQNPAAGLPSNVPTQAAFGDAPGSAAPWGGPAQSGATLPGAGPQQLVRQQGGGTNFGEVNLDGGEAGGAIDAHADEDMEFGGIPQEGQAASGAEVVRAPVAGVRRAPVEESMPPPKRRNIRSIAAVIVLIAIGGGSLALVPSLGPFGMFWIYDKVKSGEYSALLSTTQRIVHDGLASDSFPTATDAYKQADAARGKAKRLRSLAAYVAYAAYARDLRFGPDPEVSARAQVLLEDFKDNKDKDIPNLALARAAQAAVGGQLEKAKSALEGLVSSKPNDSDLLCLLAEVELKLADPASALTTWEKAEGIEKSARTAYGLGQAKLLAGDRKAAADLAKQAMSRNADHAGARILLASVTWNQGQEAGATKLLEEVTTGGKASPQELVSAYTLLGDVHLARSRVTHAENAYSEALKIDPKASKALVGMGDALYLAGRYSEALARYEAGAQANPQDVAAKVGSAKTTLALERIQDATVAIKQLRQTFPKSTLVAYWFAKVQEALGNRKDAEAAYREAIKLGGKLDPDVPQVYVGLAMLMNASGRNDDARAVLAEARKDLPDSPTIHVALGDLWLAQGRYSEAVAEFLNALKLDSGDVGARFKLGVAYRRDKKFDDAGKAFDAVAAIDAEYPGLALERGLLYEASGHTEEALKAYESALAKAPDDPDLMLRVGCGKVSLGHPKEAEELLAKVLQKRPNSAEANHCRGRALLAEGTNLAEALKTLERAVEIDPNRAEYYLYVGWAANESNRPQRAESALAKALDLDQGLADAYWQRGILRYKQGAVRDAVKDLQKALELNPNRVEAHAALADSYYDLGKEADAMHEWDLAIAAQPETATWRFRYGRLLAANHRDAEALAQLQKSLELGEKEDPKPRWLWETHMLIARTLGEKKEAISHWEAFLQLGPADSPYRSEAKKALAALGKPWDGN